MFWNQKVLPKAHKVDTFFLLYVSEVWHATQNCLKINIAKDKLSELLKIYRVMGLRECRQKNKKYLKLILPFF